MQQLPSSPVDKTNAFQKLLAFGLLAAVVYGFIKLFNAFAPTLIEFFQNIWILIGLGTPLVLAALYVITNPLVVWGFFKTLSWKLTSWIIKMDPLSVMDRYADYLTKKLHNLNTIKTELQGKRNKLERLMKTLQSNITENVKKGDAAIKQGRNDIASVCGTKAATDRNTLTLYIPIHTKMVKNLEFLDVLSENWETSIQKLRYTINAKREEHETLKDMAAALGEAEEFARGDTSAKRLYDESLKQLEIQVSLNIAKIEEFEKNSKTILGSIKVENQMIQDEGLSTIEEYRKTGELLLPDFTTYAAPVFKDPAYVQVQSAPEGNKRYNLLKGNKNV